MTYCLNPNCPNPGDPLNADNRICRHCGSSLLLQGRYHIVRLLGEGGFGKTFEITDTLGKPKVLKVLTETKTKAIDLFLKEAKVLEQLQHPGIPKVEKDGYFTYLPRNSTKALHCLVMEKIEGLNLEEWFIAFGKKPIPQQQAEIWLKQLAEILDKVHASQYFHRDIKPSNIMLRDDTGQLVLIDFGSVREVTGTYLVKVGGGGHKVTGIVSPGYTPPEQANGKALPQSDFFALGRTMVFLLTGHDPNELSENPRTGELIWRDKAPYVTPNFAGLIDYLMAPFPGNRPQNTSVILQRLQDLDFSEYSPSSTTPSIPTAVPRNVSTPLASLPRSKRKRLSNRNSQSRQKWMANKSKVLAVSLFLLVVGLLSALFPQAGSELYESLLPQLNTTLAVGSTEQAKPTNVVTSSENSWNKPTLVNTLAGHLWGVNAVAISSDGNFLISGSVDKSVNVWNLPTSKLLYSLKGHTNEIWAVAISPDGKTAASGSGDNTIHLWDLATGTPKGTLSGHTAWVLALAFSPDGKMLASGSADSSIKLWDLSNNQVLSTLTGHSDGVVAVAFRPSLGAKDKPSANVLASAGGDDKLFLWDVSSGCAAVSCVPVQSLGNQSGRVKAVAFSPDGQMLASGGGDWSINLWDLNTGNVRKLFGHSDVVNSLSFSPDGKMLVSGAGSLDSTIKLWDVAKGQLLDTLKGHGDSIHSVAFTPDGKTVVSASGDTTIKLWRLK